MQQPGILIDCVTASVNLKKAWLPGVLIKSGTFLYDEQELEVDAS